MSDENNIENNEEQNVELKSDLKSKRKSLFDKIIIFFVILCCIIVLVKFLNISFFKTIEGYRENELNKGEWIVAEDEMDKPRSPATANLLPDGNVLIMGGEDKSADTAEIFDPNQMKIIKSIPLDDKRFSGYAAITLSNGDVFIAGGRFYNKYPPLPTNKTKLFSFDKYTFKETKPMKYAKSPFPPGHSFLLKNGNILLLNNIINPNAEGRENMRFQIYNPNNNEYYETKNMIHKTTISNNHFIILENGNIIFSCYGTLQNKKSEQFNSMCLYNLRENKFEEYKNIPTEQLMIQLDSENYLCICPEENYSKGYVYNIKTKEKTLVKNNINKTWRAGTYPQTVLLENGNVLILGIKTKTTKGDNESSRIRDRHKREDVYSAYIYDKNKNIFYEIPAPPYPVYDAGIVRLKNGDILIAGGYYKEKSKRRASHSNKIQIYKYKY